MCLGYYTFKMAHGFYANQVLELNNCAFVFSKNALAFFLTYTNLKLTTFAINLLITLCRVIYLFLVLKLK